MSRKYGKVLTIILILIIIAVIGLLAYLGVDYYINYRKKKSAEEEVAAFKQGPSTATPEDLNSGAITPSDLENTNTQTVDNLIDDGTTTNNNTNNGNTDSKKRQYKGFNMLGTIEIPKTSLSYPILEKVTKKSLETAVAVIWPYENPVLNVVGNVVIVGHNYRNGTFFSNNKKLVKGDKIYITDLEKKRVTYVIYNIFETTDTDTAFYNRDTNGKREITLSTCTDDGARRLIIEAREE